VLHTIHAGVLHAFVSQLLWVFVLGNVWNIAGGADDVQQLGVLRLRSELFMRGMPSTSRTGRRG
jgi:hypothetical protein